jgi:hypothetical protein
MTIDASHGKVLNQSQRERERGCATQNVRCGRYVREKTRFEL